MYFDYKFGLRKHRGGLDESLKTKKYISFDEFQDKISFYHFYCIDDRCNQVLFISDIPSEYDWLFIEFNCDDR